jgi:hypothetical protein
MKTLTVALILFASLAHAACPEIPAAERVRIVECRSGYAVQVQTQRKSWWTRYACGWTYDAAKKIAADEVEDLEFGDAIACTPPNLPLEPVRVAE